MVISGEDASMVEDVDDDLTRELAFYHQVQLSAQLHTKGLSCLVIAPPITLLQHLDNAI